MSQTIIRTFNLINLQEKKYNDRKLDLSNSYSSKNISLNDSYLSVQTCSDESFSSDNLEIKRDHHFIKQLKINPYHQQITTLKRRVRKQQLQQTTNLQLPTTTEIFLISCPQKQQSVTSLQRPIKNSRSVVPLPPIINNSRPIQRTRIHGIKLNACN